MSEARADMAKAFDAGCARYNDLLQSWSESRGRHLTAEAELAELKPRFRAAQDLVAKLDQDVLSLERHRKSYIAEVKGLKVQIADMQTLLDEAKTREHQAERFAPSAMECGWPACVSVVTREELALAIDPTRYDRKALAITHPGIMEMHDIRIAAAVTRVRALFRRKLDVSREGEAGSRSAAEPNANLAGPEGDTRPNCIHCYGKPIPKCIYCGGVGHKPKDCPTPCDYDTPCECDPQAWHEDVHGLNDPPAEGDVRPEKCKWCGHTNEEGGTGCDANDCPLREDHLRLGGGAFE